MICKNPYVKGSVPFGCGQCLPCRINRRRLWTHRLMLESLKHDASSFVTLTYSPEHYPHDGSLDPKDVQDFLKRLRWQIRPKKIRYYAVGEYGDTTFRAHYHLALFGLGEDATEIIGKAWSKGNVVVGSLTPESAGYVCGYVTKKMTSSDDPRLGGKHPEFARMSLRPGIGADAMEDVAKIYHTREGAKELARTMDVPMALKHGKKSMPLGRYLRKKLREELDLPELGVESPSFKEKILEMSDMFKTHRATSQGHKKALVYEMNKQKIRSIEARYRIFKKRTSL